MEERKQIVQRNIFVAVAIFIVFLMLLLGGAYVYKFLSLPSEKEMATKTYEGKVVIGYVTWPGYLGLYLARDKGYFKDEGVNVELRKYDDILVATKDYADGKIQGRINVPLATVGSIQGADSTISQKIVLATDYSNGADGIVAKSGISTVTQLKGKRVAFQQGTIEEVLTKYALEQNGLKISDIVAVNLDPEKAAKALIEGQVDAATTYEPFLEQTAKQVNGKVIYSSANAPGLIIDIVTFNSAFVNEYPETMRDIVRAYFRGVTFWREHPDEANQLLANELGISPAEAREQLKMIKILDKRDNEAIFTSASGVQSLFGNLRQMRHFTSQGSDSQENTDQLIEPKFIRNLSE